MRLRTVKTSALMPGMLLGQDVLQPSGAFLLQKGTVLTKAAINKLRNWDIPEVVIEEPNKGEQKDELEAKLRPEMSRSHARTVGLMERVLTRGAEEAIETEVVRSAVGEIMNQIELGKDVLLGLTHLQSYDNYVFSHSVNVCVLSLIIGEGLNLSTDDLKEIGEAALMHDLGMLNVPAGIWSHQRSLAQEELLEIRKHPIYGRDLLQNIKDFSPRVANTAYQHHERCDGSGYPQGIQGVEIDRFARIIAIADVYDACISPRPHRDSMTPKEALNSLTLEKEKYDPEILYTFLSVMAIYPIGCFVQLSTGELARVIGIQKNQPFRPEIRVFTDREGNVLPQPYRVNLNDKNFLLLHITRTLERNEIKAVLQGISPEYNL
jgi:HD-GYP domain-containing protein (c-di-GMP phosphodiesterase class II)